MQRRTFLGTLVGGATVGLAGCSILSGPDPAEVGAIPEDDELPPPTQGTGDVGVAVFSDYLCPACKSFEQQVVPDLLTQYVDTGKITYVHRDFPLQNHAPWALKTASAMRAIQETAGNDAFWTATERVYDPAYFKVDSLSDVEAVADPFGQETVDAARTAADTVEYEDRIQADKELGENIGVRGTPTVFVDGSTVSSGVPGFDSISQAIEDAL